MPNPSSVSTPLEVSPRAPHRYGFWREFGWWWWRRWDHLETWAICAARLVHRVWRYRWVLAHDYDFDWTPLAQLMEIKLGAMADSLDHSYHVRAERDAQQCRVAAALCHRLIDGSYYEDMHGLKWDRQWVERVEASSTGDCRYLGLLIGKHMRGWWA